MQLKNKLKGLINLNVYSYEGFNSKIMPDIDLKFFMLFLKVWPIEILRNFNKVATLFQIFPLFIF